MALTRSNRIAEISGETDTSSNVTELNVPNKNSHEHFDEDVDWQDEPNLEQYYSEEEPVINDQNSFQAEGSEPFEEDGESRGQAQNQVSLTFSWSLMNQLRYLARNEGVPVEDLLIELIAEGVTKRAFEDQNKPLPSHLMTRNGYVHNNDSHSGLPQPQMSHHALNNNRNNNGQINRNKTSPQTRNNQYNNNGSRYQNSHNNRNYQNNNRNQQNNTVSFNKQQGNSYNNQQRYPSRSSNYSENSSKISHENNDSNQQGHTNKNKRF